MTTYTMNGHKLPTRQLQPEIVMGIARNHAARITRAQWRLKAQREKFSCLENADPGAQLQAALKQIEMLLQENTQLVQTVLLLDHALSNAQSLIHENEGSGQSDAEQPCLSHDFHRYMDQLRSRFQTLVLE